MRPKQSERVTCVVSDLDVMDCGYKKKRTKKTKRESEFEKSMHRLVWKAAPRRVR